MADSPVQVAVHGVSLGSIITGTGAWGAFLALIGVIIRQRVPMRKIDADQDAKLIDTLSARVAKLEADLAAISTSRDQERAAREQERAAGEATLALMRHRANNADQCIDALLMMLEAAPDRVPQAIALVKDMRSRQREAQAVEQAAIHAAKISATASPN